MNINETEKEYLSSHSESFTEFEGNNKIDLNFLLSNKVMSGEEKDTADWTFNNNLNHDSSNNKGEDIKNLKEPIK